MEGHHGLARLLVFHNPVSGQEDAADEMWMGAEAGSQDPPEVIGRSQLSRRTPLQLRMNLLAVVHHVRQQVQSLGCNKRAGEIKIMSLNPPQFHFQTKKKKHKSKAVKPNRLHMGSRK